MQPYIVDNSATGGFWQICRGYTSLIENADFIDNVRRDSHCDGELLNIATCNSMTEEVAKNINTLEELKQVVRNLNTNHLTKEAIISSANVLRGRLDYIAKTALMPEPSSATVDLIIQCSSHVEDYLAGQLIKEDFTAELKKINCCGEV
jgi:hypothetical protein